MPLRPGVLGGSDVAPEAEADNPIAVLVPEHATLSPQLRLTRGCAGFVHLPMLRAREKFDIVVAVVAEFQRNSALRAHAGRRLLIPRAQGRPLLGRNLAAF